MERGPEQPSGISGFLFESNKPAEIVVECKFSTGLGQLWPLQQRVTVYTLSAYIQMKSPGLASWRWGGIQAA